LICSISEEAYCLTNCNIIWYLFPDDDPLWAETCRSISVVMYCKYQRKIIVHFVGWVLWIAQWVYIKEIGGFIGWGGGSFAFSRSFHEFLANNSNLWNWERLISPCNLTDSSWIFWNVLRNWGQSEWHVRKIGVSWRHVNLCTDYWYCILHLSYFWDTLCCA
jgi:hypothetical protein